METPKQKSMKYLQKIITGNLSYDLSVHIEKAIDIALETQAKAILQDVHYMLLAGDFKTGMEELKEKYGVKE